MLMSFPHTRGKFTNEKFYENSDKKFPPYAGEVYLGFLLSLYTTNVSPIRGGSLLALQELHLLVPGFPHTRGKFTNTVYQSYALFPFPPYAGEVYIHPRTYIPSAAVSPIRGGSLLYHKEKHMKYIPLSCVQRYDARCSAVF